MKGLLTSLLFAAFWAGAEAAPKPSDEPTFAVLVIERDGQKTFKVLPSDEVQAERSRIAKENQAAMAPWEKRSQAFLKDPAHKGKPFPEPKPETTTATVRRDGFILKKDAKAFAEIQKEAGRKAKEEAEATYAVVRITEQMGLAQARIEVVREDLIGKRCDEIRKDFQERKRKRAALRYQVLSGGYNPVLTGKFDHKAWYPTTLNCLKRGIPDKAEAERIRVTYEKRLKLTNKGDAPK